MSNDGKRVIWEITNQCNYSCSYCIFSSKKEKDPLELTTKQAKNVISSLKKHGYRYLKITGGEPFLRKDLLELMQFATDLGFIIDISTNASLINQSIISGLKKINLDLIHVSLDGHDKESQEFVRGMGSYQPTINGLKMLVEAGFYVRIGCLIHRQNEQSIEKIINFCIRLGVKQVIFSMMEPVGRMKNNFAIISQVPVDILKARVKELAKQYDKQIDVKESFAHQIKNGEDRQCCPGSKLFLYIDQLGRISPCPWITSGFTDFFSIGNLKENSLSQLLKDENICSFQQTVNSATNCGLVGCPMQFKEDFAKLKNLNKFFNQGKFQFSNQKKYSSFSPIYAFTTEKLSSYLKLFDLKNKLILTATGSGDQLINAYLLGAKQVDCFDVNQLSGYYLDLKLNALKLLSYQSFQKFLFRSDGKGDVLSLKTFKKIEKQLKPVTKYFFNYLYNLHQLNGYSIRESGIFNNNFDNKLQATSNNLYLKDAHSYRQVQENTSLNSEFFNYNVLDLFKFKKIPKQYDFINLSNIADYLHKDELFLSSSNSNYIDFLKENIINPAMHYLKPGGFLMLAYLYQVNNLVLRNQLYDEALRTSQLLDRQYSLHQHQFLGVDQLSDDCIIYLKKK